MLFIGASQGHIISQTDDRQLLGNPISELGPDEVCCHATYSRLLPLILKEGLKPGGEGGAKHRKHLHCSVSPPGKDVISGTRQDCGMVVYVDFQKAPKFGIGFYKIINNVFLTEGVIPPVLFSEIREARANELLLRTARDEMNPTGGTACNVRAGRPMLIAPNKSCNRSLSLHDAVQTIGSWSDRQLEQRFVLIEICCAPDPELSKPEQFAKD